MANGQSIGAILGGVAGTTIAPGVGGAVGAQIGQTAGGLIESGVQGRKANQLAPGLVDPLEQQRINELNQIRKNISTGSDAATQGAIGEAQKVGATTQGRIARSTGGDVGSTVNALIKAQKGTQAATNQAVVQGQQRLPFVEQLTQQLGTRISQRTLELGLLNQNRAKAASAQAGTDALQNLGSLAALQGTLPGQNPAASSAATPAAGATGATGVAGDIGNIIQSVSGLLGGGAGENAGAPPLATPGINPNAQEIQNQTIDNIRLGIDKQAATPAIDVPQTFGL